ncbi:TIGR03668 family PPOX class F420-dependent oxidoreductase [Catenulispora sp. NF23]|uniref:TIGR03668 family PPOX class F420-dependent oxidoreductase n=1 Tax=Catenulispora pinistramenti TaxID=2705254 RepID=A0ABS5KUV1_9ACTN|nr:TIGR03668 family PPOX class F420-dependent oxidoreductase [Catenulispora pinistramenti]MBS2534172.1 TIGR03668 family PPOX class F420-dependent oxidoreductase [Catenulispora pinistramenti]MBS2549790.1 TIGR03668 family PPOX class F420-dependent oxidoreductase [Catenulispora pinistramenti]
MTPEEAKATFLARPHAILATADASGVPHLVPVVFAAVGEALALVVDHKPKRSTDLKRLRNIQANPHVSLLTEHYTADWSVLWWARADGTAHVSPLTPAVLAAFERKYPQYRAMPPQGPAIAVTVAKWSGWTA